MHALDTCNIGKKYTLEIVLLFVSSGLILCVNTQQIPLCLYLYIMVSKNELYICLRNTMKHISIVITQIAKI